MKINLVPRSLDFTVALLQRLVKNPDQEMEEAVKDSYNITLKPWHGWISSAAYRVTPPTSFKNLCKMSANRY